MFISTYIHAIASMGRCYSHLLFLEECKDALSVVYCLLRGDWLQGNAEAQTGVQMLLGLRVQCVEVAGVLASFGQSFLLSVVWNQESHAVLAELHYIVRMSAWKLQHNLPERLIIEEIAFERDQSEFAINFNSFNYSQQIVALQRLQERLRVLWVYRECLLRELLVLIMLMSMSAPKAVMVGSLPILQVYLADMMVVVEV